MSKSSDPLARFQNVILDAARIGKQEIARGVVAAKTKLEQVQLVQKRKECYAELGRAMYEAYKDGLPPEVEKFIRHTEFLEIIKELDKLNQDET